MIPHANRDSDRFGILRCRSVTDLGDGWVVAGADTETIGATLMIADGAGLLALILVAASRNAAARGAAYSKANRPTSG